jgi:tetratricopeptide (TPR) repeat protein
MKETENEYQEIIDIVHQAIEKRNASNPKQALSIIEKAVELGSALPNLSTEYAYSLHIKANIFQDLNEFSKSYDGYYQAYRVYASAGNKGSAFHSLWHAGAAASEEGKIDEAKAIFRKCLGNLDEIEITTIQQANFYRNLALHEERIDNLIGSYALWLHCLSLYQDIDLKDAIDECNERITEIRSRLKE